ncbi:MAG: membrane protein insertion efficiency factor YidD [Planctomycetota bacterium]|jgi:putative membrane protein insertion efficiency factor
MRALKFIKGFARRLFVLLIRGYQLYVSPLTPGTCRFRPTCSQYMLEAIRKKGLVVGLAKGLLRLLRCNPLFPGGYDPVR